MSRKKSPPKGPLPPRDGLGASRVRVPIGGEVTAWDFLTQVIAGQRHRHPGDNDNALSGRFAAGEVQLRDGTVLTPESIVVPGDDVFFYKIPAPEKPVPYEIETVYEDNDILVVNKPPFLATMPRAAHITETATVRLRRQTDNEQLTPAHRLDRMTSGLLLLTKRQELRGPYQSLFAERAVHKLYEAIAPASNVQAGARWEHHIRKTHGEIAAELIDDTPNSLTNVITVDPVDPAPFAAHQVEGPLARYILEPVTGRTHQLRIQMLAAGVPILGDPVYPDVHPFGEEDFHVPMRLTSVALGFVDPLSGRERRFSIPGYSALPVPEL